ncbi:MAG: hypothetical protein E7356_01245 [Clostridiales bacterium]|nr:hypothetical protein [Clostridiales bacterium]
MKKISRLMAVLVICLSSLLFSTACGVEIVSGTVVPGTLEVRVVKGDTIDTSNVIARITYSDDEVVTVTADELEFSEVDTSEAGIQVLEITYEGFTFKVNITVFNTESDMLKITEFNSSDVNIFNENVNSNPQQFYNVKSGDGLEVKTRYVGTDNPWVVDLVVSGKDASNKTITAVKNVTTDITVELKTGNDYVVLDETTTPKLSDVVESISEVDAKIKFKAHQDVWGKDFRVTIEPEMKNNESQTILKVVEEIRVIEGYNVHNAKEMAIYDNSGNDYDKDGAADWFEIKKEVGQVISADQDGKNAVYKTASTIILQNNINITAKDVPSTNFWTDNKSTVEFHRNWDEGQLGTLFDYAQSITDQPLKGSFVDRDNTGVYTITISLLVRHLI